MENIQLLKAASKDSASNSFPGVNLVHLIRAYQTMGHLKAQIDPLNLLKPEDVPALNPETYGFTKEDYVKEFSLQGNPVVEGRARARQYFERDEKELKLCLF
jgi:2-oxoglutarate dehydrogenase complex dehydrogenase (E1) component-like enzyme